MRAAAVILIFSATLPGCRAAPRLRPSLAPAADIYRVVLDSLYVSVQSSHRPVRQIVLQARTEAQPEGPRNFLCSSSPKCDAPKDLLDAFARANANEDTIEAVTGGEPPVHILGAAEAAAIFRPSSDPFQADSWHRFYSRFPGAPGIALVSPVAVDSTGSWAVLAYELDCGALCGEVWWVLLRRIDAAWRIVRATHWLVS